MFGLFSSKDYFITPSMEGVALPLEDVKKNSLQKAAKIWDAAFDIKLKDVQAKIGEINAANQAAIKGAEHFVPKDSGGIVLKQNSIIVFGHEDDWYHPDLFQRLHSQKSYKHDVIIWRACQFGFQLYHNGEKGAPMLRYVLRSPQTLHNNAERHNSYAFTGRFFITRQLDVANIIQHAAKSASVFSEAGNIACTINDVLSMMHRHPCSRQILTHIATSDPSPLVLRKLVKVYVQSALAPDLAEEYRWAKPHIEASKDIFAEVLKSYKGK